MLQHNIWNVTALYNLTTCNAPAFLVWNIFITDALHMCYSCMYYMYITCNIPSMLYTHGIFLSIVSCIEFRAWHAHRSNQLTYSNCYHRVRGSSKFSQGQRKVNPSWSRSKEVQTLVKVRQRSNLGHGQTKVKIGHGQQIKPWTRSEEGQTLVNVRQMSNLGHCQTKIKHWSRWAGQATGQSNVKPRITSSEVFLLTLFWPKGDM